MNLQQIKYIYLIGIGGIGMSALARYFHLLGKKVSGYDKTQTLLTKELIDEGIHICFEDEINLIPDSFKNKTETLVVITPAIPDTHKQRNYFLNESFHLKKRAEVLGMITKNSYCLAVAGTHGKTTTSSMLAHLLFDNQLSSTSFLGGVLENYQTNLVGDGTRYTVVEADEFDRSFLHLHPNVSCVLSTDADHLDIYKSDKAMKKSFQQFANKLSDKKYLFVEEHTGLEGVLVGFSEKCDIRPYNIRFENQFQVFDLKFFNEDFKSIKLLMPGKHNIINATMAISMAKTTGLDIDLIKKSFINFKGIRRRFSYKVRNDHKVYIDDYAHHPTEINAVAQAVNDLYSGKNILAVFQPHLFSRTQDFMNEFAESLSQFSKIVLLDIYPARELPIKGVTSQVLLNKITSQDKILVTKHELVSYIKKQQFDVLLTIGAGDIGELSDVVKKVVEEL